MEALAKGDVETANSFMPSPETRLFLSRDDGQSWVEIDVPAKHEIRGIDHVLVTGNPAQLLLSIRFFNDPWMQAVLEPAPVVAQNPSAQDSAPEVASPVAPVVMEWPKVEVIWTEVKRFDPSTIPVEEGFYGGQRGNELSYNPEDLTDIPESAAYVWRILPQLSEENQPISSDPSKPSREIFLAAARNPSKDVVLVSIATSISPHYYILLSADGEKSWCMLNLLPAGESKNNTPSITRVVAQGEEIHLYGRYALGPGPDHLYWWGAVVKKSELPCS